MIKSLFKFGSHLFLISSVLSFLFKFGHHEEEKHEEKKLFSLGKIVALVGAVAALGFLFEEKRKADEHEHHHLF